MPLTQVRITAGLLPKGGPTAAVAMSGPDSGLGRQDQKPFLDSANQLIIGTAWKISSADTADKKRITGDKVGGTVKTHSARGMTGV